MEVLATSLITYDERLLKIDNLSRGVVPRRIVSSSLINASVYVSSEVSDDMSIGHITKMLVSFASLKDVDGRTAISSRDRLMSLSNLMQSAGCDIPSLRYLSAKLRV